MSLGSGRAYTRFPALQSCSHGEHIKCSPARAELAINLVYARPLPRGSHPKCRAKAPHTNFFFQLKHAGNSTRANYPCRTLSTPIQPKSYIDTERSPTGGAGYKVYREFRTQRRPLNVAFVLRRTVEQETLYPAPPVGDRTRMTTASCSDRHRRRTARFRLGRIYGGQPLRSWRRCRCTPKAVAPLRGSPDAQAS